MPPSIRDIGLLSFANPLSSYSPTRISPGAPSSHQTHTTNRIMCTTTQYLFQCSHAASHRFRNAVCDAKGTPECQLRDLNSVLPEPCHRCTVTARAWPILNVLNLKPNKEQELYQDTWHIPSRCFIDCGFGNLDPFGAEEGDFPALPEQKPKRRKSVRLWEQFGNKDGDGPYSQLVAKVKRSKRTSPCCVDESEYGAFEATRLEECEDRVESRIVDSHCESLQ